MNRRSFLAAMAGFAILPSARTYQRAWKATQAGVLVPSFDVGTGDETHILTITNVGEGELHFYSGALPRSVGSARYNLTIPSAKGGSAALTG